MRIRASAVLLLFLCGAAVQSGARPAPPALDDRLTASRLRDARRILERAAESAEAADGATKEADPSAALRVQIAEAKARAGDRQSALETVNRIQDLPRRAEALAAVAAELARAGDCTGALELASQIAGLRQQVRKEAAPGTPGMGTDVRESLIAEHHAVAIGSVVLAQARAGDWQGALKSVELQEGYRCTGLFAVAAVRLANGDRPAARKLLESSEHFHAEFTAQKDTYLSLVDAATALAFLDHGARTRSLTTDFRRIFDLYGRIRTLHEIEHYGYLYGILAQAGHQKEVDQALTAWSKKVELDPGYLSGVVTGLLWADDLKNARRAAELLPGEDNQSLARWRVAEALARKGDFAVALQTAEAIKTRPIRAVALATVAARQMEKGGGPAADRALKGAVATATATRDVRYRLEALCWIARAQAAAGDRAAAGKTLEEAVALGGRRPVPGYSDDFFLPVLVRTYLAIRDHAAALRLATEPPGLKLSPRGTAQLLGEIGLALAKADKRDEADRVFAQGLERASSVDVILASTLREIAQPWARYGRSDAAVAAAERLSSPLHRAYALLGAAMGLLQQVNPDFYPEDSEPEDSEAWSQKLGCLALAAGDQANREAPRSFPQLAASPALLILVRSEDTPGPAPQSRPRVEEARRFLVEAGKAAAAVTEPEIRRILLDMICREQTRAMDFPGALRTAQGLQEGGRETVRAGIYMHRLAGMLRAKNFRSAIQLVAGSPPGLLEVASAQLKARDVAGSLKTVSRIRSQQPAVVQELTALLAQIAGRQVASRQWAAATQTLRRAERLTAGLEFAAQRSEARERMASALAEEGDTAGALRVALAIEEPYPRTLALVGIATHRARQGDLRGARQALRRLPPALIRTEPLAQIAIAEATAKRPAEAARTVRELLATGRSGDQETRSDELRKVAEAQAKAGDVRGALSTAACIPIATARAGALLAAAGAQARAGDTKGAARTVELALPIVPAISQPGEISEAVTLLLQAAAVLRKTGDRTGSVRTLMRGAQHAAKRSPTAPSDEHREIVKALLSLGDPAAAVEAAESLVSGTAKAQLWMEVAGERLRSGGRDDAAALVQRALKVTAEFPEGETGDRSPDYVQRQAYESIAVVQLRLGEVATALQTVNRVEDDGWNRQGVLLTLASTQAEMGDTVAALQIAQRIPVPHVFRAYALADIARQQSKRGGDRPVREWIDGLSSPLDRAAALLGVAEAMLDGAGLPEPLWS